MKLTRRALNRTLLHRQQLLERTTGSPSALVTRLVGLQAQESLPPYLSLAARLDDLDPLEVSQALAERRLVRIGCLRGTIHLVEPDDAVTLRPWTEPVREREMKASQVVRPALGLDRERFVAELGEVLADGPLGQPEICARLAQRHPDVPPTALGQLARVLAPLAQLPPRGCWKASGGVVYDYVDRWTGRPLAEPDVQEIVRRYLAAFGPASAADVTTWSGVTRLGPVVAAMDDLVRHTDESGRVLFDIPDGPLADEDAPAPVRLLGTYDNVWLSHAARDRVTEPEKRRAWMGVNGGVANVILVDGWLEGLWRIEDGRVSDVSLLRSLTAGERAGLDEEISRLETLLAR
ncbi:winged helix DNA-binding domain-containing protein [Nocardioides sp. CER19]|uniref:winged helix DNA-binding domain-containing protein n=1 Tax=Nocardioides sp. CER19 TaxID=3038538 RepID=UPI002449A094|nr:winged helix DNA-binding domain-containing protein [Nocardioides sp. CER19]MDH2415504.1 winged helix DNA-binding domain-containing protein [Nocardioides sp. CER19]